MSLRGAASAATWQSRNVRKFAVRHGIATAPLTVPRDDPTDVIARSRQCGDVAIPERPDPQSQTFFTRSNTTCPSPLMSSVFAILFELVRGISSTYATYRGTLNAASRSAQNFATLSGVT